MGGKTWGCRYLQGGLSFSYASINACAVIHHGTGEPTLADYRGGPVPHETLAEARREVIRANQNGGHPACRGCPNLVEDEWPEPDESVDWLGITHWIGCNIACDYCWLQWSDWSPRNATTRIPAHPYDLRPAVLELIADGRLAPDAVIDWGGGGEPTTAPEFDELLVVFDRHGTEQWVHTNAVRLPEPVRDGQIDESRLHILCSVDAGTVETYTRIKGRDHFETVWSNLAAYLDQGAHVTAKYVVEDSNLSRIDLRGFVDRAAAVGVATVIGDIDHRFPDPTEDIVGALALLSRRCEAAGIYFVYGSTGANSAPEFDVATRIAARNARDRRRNRSRRRRLRRRILSVMAKPR